jgi:hypothetical protein
VIKASKTNPDGVRVLDAQLNDRVFVSTYANLGNTSVLNELIENARMSPNHFLRSFVQSAEAHFGRKSRQSRDAPIIWHQAAKTELLKYAAKDHGLTEDDINGGCPLDLERWPISKPLERRMASYMATMLLLLRKTPKMTQELDQWWVGDIDGYAKRKTLIDERSPERLYAAFCVLHIILSELKGKRAEARGREKSRRNTGHSKDVQSANSLEYMTLDDMQGAFSEEESALTKIGEHFGRLVEDVPNAHWGATSALNMLKRQYGSDDPTTMWRHRDMMTVEHLYFFIHWRLRLCQLHQQLELFALSYLMLVRTLKQWRKMMVWTFHPLPVRTYPIFYDWIGAQIVPCFGSLAEKPLDSWVTSYWEVRRVKCMKIPVVQFLSPT